MKQVNEFIRVETIIILSFCNEKATFVIWKSNFY